MQRHVKTLGILNIVWGALGAFSGVAVMLIFGGTFGIVGAALRDRPDAAVVLPIIATVGGAIALFLLILSVPSIVAGIALLHRRPWAPTLAIIVSALHLLNFPLGTALGIYGLWVLLSDAGREYFGAKAH